MKRWVLVFLAVFFLIPASVSGELFYLRDGRILKGTISSETKEHFYINLYEGGRKKIAKSDILRIEEDIAKGTTHIWKELADKFYKDAKLPDRTACSALRNLLSSLKGVHLLKMTEYFQETYGISFDLHCSHLIELCPSSNGNDHPFSTCERCEGEGRILNEKYTPVECPACGGSGKRICPACKTFVLECLSFRSRLDGILQSMSIIYVSDHGLKKGQLDMLKEIWRESDDVGVARHEDAAIYVPAIRTDNSNRYMLVTRRIEGLSVVSYLVYKWSLKAGFCFNPPEATEENVYSSNSVMIYENYYRLPTWSIVVYDNARKPSPPTSCIETKTGEVNKRPFNYAMGIGWVNAPHNFYPAVEHLRGGFLIDLFTIQVYNDSSNYDSVYVIMQVDGFADIVTRKIELPPEKVRELSFTPTYKDSFYQGRNSQKTVVRVWISLTQSPSSDCLVYEETATVCPLFDMPRPAHRKYMDIYASVWVTPVDSNNIIMRTIEECNAKNGSSAFAAYQKYGLDPVKDRRRALKEIGIVYDFLRYKRIMYLSTTWVAEQPAQRIRPPGEVLTTCSGNCIELTCLMASLMEVIGYDTIIVTTSNHAFLLVTDIPYNRIRKDEFEEHIIALEMTGLPDIPFPEVYTSGHVEFNKAIIEYFDGSNLSLHPVRRLRELGIKPCPRF